MTGKMAVLIGSCLLATSIQATPAKVGEHSVTIEQVERAEQWQDPVGGIYAEKIRAGAGEEVLLVSLAAEATGSLKLEGFVARGSDGTEYRALVKAIEESRFDAAGKPSTAKHNFKRTIPFVVPKGADIVAIVIQGTSVPVPKGTKAKP